MTPARLRNPLPLALAMLAVLSGALVLLGGCGKKGPLYMPEPPPPPAGAAPTKTPAPQP